MLGVNFIKPRVMIRKLPYIGKSASCTIDLRVIEEICGNCQGRRGNRATLSSRTSFLGDFNTTVGGFSRSGATHSFRKRYVRSVMTTAKIERPKEIPDIVFFSEDLKGVLSHEDDMTVLSVITMDRNMHRVLIDQGSSIDVIFWETFVGLQILVDRF